MISSVHLDTFSDKHYDYLSCQLRKHHALPFDLSKSVFHALSDLIHFDIWGLSLTLTIGDSLFCHFVDDYSRYASFIL